MTTLLFIILGIVSASIQVYILKHTYCIHSYYETKPTRGLATIVVLTSLIPLINLVEVSFFAILYTILYMEDSLRFKDNFFSKEL